MRRWALLISLGIIICLTGFQSIEARSKKSHIRRVYSTQQLVSQINHAIQGVSPGTHIGISIKSMKYGDTIYSHNDKTLFVPASTLKVFTAEAALLYLGPEFKFPTRIVTDAKSINNGTLNGNIYLINSGDPSLTYYDVADLIEMLKSQQIQAINGNVYIDNTAYDQATTGPGWLGKDTKYCYGAPISASIINHNCLSYHASPPKTNLTAISDPSIYYAGFHNPIINHYRSRECEFKISGEQNGLLSISDCESKSYVSYGHSPSNVITNVMDYDRALLQALFQRYNIQVHGNISPGTAIPQSSELARHESKPLRELISNMLKMSDNIIAGSLFKKIGELYTHRQGTWENGGNAVSQILSQHAELNLWRSNLIDGSGLSRYNQVTPAQLLQVLDFAFHNNATNYDFISALPVAGIDGTLKRRMRNLAWKVRAKTGTMQGVVSLAGYATSADKEPFAFVIMINGKGGSVWQYRDVEDKILNYLTHYSRA